MLARRLAGLAFVPACAPRPGAIARKATIIIRTSESGLRVKFTTTPANAEVAACLERGYTHAFRDFGPGTWKLAFAREYDIPPQMSPRTLKAAIEITAPSIVTDCWPPNQPARFTTIAVIAKTDAEGFAITTTSTDLPSFEACFVPKLDAALRGALSRQFSLGASGTYQYQPYFRIDDDAEASVWLKVETPDQRDVRMGRQPQPR